MLRIFDRHTVVFYLFFIFMAPSILCMEVDAEPLPRQETMILLDNLLKDFDPSNQILINDILAQTQEVGQERPEVNEKEKEEEEESLNNFQKRNKNVCDRAKSFEHWQARYFALFDQDSKKRADDLFGPFYAWIFSHTNNYDLDDAQTQILGNMRLFAAFGYFMSTKVGLKGQYLFPLKFNKKIGKTHLASLIQKNPEKFLGILTTISLEQKNFRIFSRFNGFLDNVLVNRQNLLADTKVFISSEYFKKDMQSLRKLFVSHMKDFVTNLVVDEPLEEPEQKKNEGLDYFFALLPDYLLAHNVLPPAVAAFAMPILRPIPYPQHYVPQAQNRQQAPPHQRFPALALPPLPHDDFSHWLAPAPFFYPRDDLAPLAEEAVPFPHHLFLENEQIPKGLAAGVGVLPQGVVEPQAAYRPEVPPIAQEAGPDVNKYDGEKGIALKKRKLDTLSQQQSITVVKHNNSLLHTRPSGSQFFGDPKNARCADAQERREIDNILKTLERHRKELDEENYENARRTIELFKTAICENIQVCKFLFREFKNGAWDYGSYPPVPELILHPTEDDMPVEKRAFFNFQTLKGAFEIAQKQNCMVHFFTTAFFPPGDNTVCLESAQQALSLFSAERIEESSRLESSNTLTRASDEKIFKILRSVVDELRRTLQLPATLERKAIEMTSQILAISKYSVSEEDIKRCVDLLSIFEEATESP